MTRTLEFRDTEEGRLRYVVCLVGMFFTGNRQHAKGLEVARREGRVLDKLEGIGLRPADIPEGIEYRELRPGDQRIALDAAEFEMLKRYVAEAPWPASAARYMPSAREALKVYDGWLVTIEPGPTT